MKRLHNYLLFLLLTVGMIACSDNEADSPLSASETNFTSYSIRGFSSQAQIDTEAKSVFLRLPDDVADGGGLYPEFTVSEGATVTINQVPQVSGAQALDFNDLVLYTITSQDGENKSRWRVTVTNNDYTAAYGMGNFLTASCSNDGSSPEGFYYQQQHSGANANDNCGPACVTMAMRWSDPTYSGTVEDARNEIPVSEIDGGVSWYPRDIYNFLNHHGVPAYYWDFTNATYDGFIRTICTKLEEGNLAIVCLNTINVSEQQAMTMGYHTHKYYSGGAGHFLLIKGYRVVNGVTWFEIHDPWGLDKKYEDGTYMGANRYYLGHEVATSIDWNIWTVIVPPGKG